MVCAKTFNIQLNNRIKYNEDNWPFSIHILPVYSRKETVSHIISFASSGPPPRLWEHK